MYKVAIDARMYDHPGIGRYIRELVGSIAGDGSEVFDYTLIDRVELPDWQGPSKSKFDHMVVSSPIYSFSEQFRMWQKSKSFDLLHVPHFNAPIYCRSKLVVTIHDLIYLHHTGATKSLLGKFYVRQLIERITLRADAILTVSEYSKWDLIQSFPKMNKDKVFVTHEAASKKFAPEKKVISDHALKLLSIEKPYVLFVGSLKSHKNIPILLKAMKLFRESSKIDAELLVVGRKDTKDASVLQEIEKCSKFSRYLGELGDSAIVSLYNRCEVFVLPSLWEGFGLPVLEAMSCGAPVIVSDRTSLPEIAGDAGLVFDAMSAEALAHQIQKVFTDADLRKRLSIAGLARAQEFSWKKTATKTLEVYRKALQ